MSLQRIGSNVDLAQTKPLNFPGLWRWLFKQDYQPNIIRFVGSRAELEGPHPGDLSLLYQLPFDSRVPVDVKPDITHEEIVKQYGEKDKLISAGIATPLSWDCFFWPIRAPRTLGMISDAIREGNCLPVFFDYDEATLKRMQEVEERVRQNEGEEGVRKIREVFRSIYGHDSTTYLTMPYSVVKELGRKGRPEERQYGIKSQDWTIQRRKENGERETLLVCDSIDEINTKGEGISGGIIFMGDDVYNFQHNMKILQSYQQQKIRPSREELVPNKKVCMVTGARGVDSEIMWNLFGGSNLGRRYKREYTERKVGDSVIVEEVPTREYNWIIEGLDEVAKEIWNYIEREKKPYNGIEIALVTKIVNDEEMGWYVPEVVDLLDIEFLLYDKSGLRPIPTTRRTTYTSFV